MCLAAKHRAMRPNCSELTCRCGLLQTCRFGCCCLRCCHRLSHPSKLRAVAAFSSGLRNTLPFRVTCHSGMVSALRPCCPTSTHRIAPPRTSTLYRQRHPKQRLRPMTGAQGCRRTPRHSRTTIERAARLEDGTKTAFELPIRNQTSEVHRCCSRTHAPGNGLESKDRNGRCCPKPWGAATTYPSEALLRDLRIKPLAKEVTCFSKEAFCGSLKKTCKLMWYVPHQRWCRRLP